MTIIPDFYNAIRTIQHTGEGNGSVFELAPVVKTVVFGEAEASVPDLFVAEAPTHIEIANRDMYAQFHGKVSDIGFYFMSDVTLRGRGFFKKDADLIYAPDLIPDYVRDEILRGVRLEVYDKPDRLEKNLPGLTVFLTSEGYPIYGHWLIDTLPKCWMFRERLGSPLRVDRFLFAGDTPQYGLDMLTETFGLSGQNFEFYELETEEPRLEKALVPSLMHNSHLFHPAMREAVQDIVRMVKTKHVEKTSTNSSPYIYISRDKFRDRTISSKRELSNEDEIKTIVRSRGIEVVYPEELSWNEQVELFSNTKLIVGESGSGLHNSIFAPENTIILCMQPATQVQGTLSALLGHPTAFLCPESVTTIDGTAVFDIDLKRFTALLDQCLARTRI